MRQAFGHLGVTTKLLWTLFRLSSDERSNVFDSDQSKLILASIEEKLPELKVLERAQFLFYKAFYSAKRRQDAVAIDAVQEAQQILRTSVFTDRDEMDQAQKLINLNNWNAGCILLKASQFEIAWKLFEWGLRCPAQGRQRWQRSIQKLFTHQEVALWRGESLCGRRLLLLEEQAVGDTMMFLTLLPKLLDQAAHVGLLLSARLVPIYQRSCQHWIDNGRVSVWSHKAAASGKLSSNDFDYQSPVGSVCQYIANRIENFRPRCPF